ncbi:MAG TPA: amidohydrolase [Gemmatimonadaceae bacterium]|nr:amidohydrolase [Gemmatimonadaceae bacterium]
MRALAGAALAVVGVTGLFSLPADAPSRRDPAPDLVLLGGRVFTADSTRPWAQALAIRGDRIVAVGTTSSVLALAGPATRRIRLGGRVVVPGFNDAHAHLASSIPGVAFRTSDDPVPDPPFAWVRDSVAALARRTPPGTRLVTSIDAAVLDDPLARRAALDAVAPGHPVWLVANTGHGMIANTAALREVGIAEEAPDPAGGFYERDGAPYPGHGHGRLTGLLHEYAAWNATRTLRSHQPDSVHVAAFRRYAERALRSGITSVQDMADALDPATTLRALRLAQLPIRVRVVPMPGTDAAGRRTTEWQAALHDPAWRASAGARLPTGARLGATKWIVDGTGIERLGLLRAPYADRPTWFGRLNFPPDTLRALLRESLLAGEQPVLHAIGDSAIVLVLSTMESLAPDSAWRRLRPRLEHAEWLTPDLRARARRLGITVVENPTHFTDGADRMHARFGVARAREYQPFGSLPTAGIALAIGSDGPMDPFLNLQLAITHPDNPREALTRESAVTAYTRGSAFAEHAEHEKGTLAPGMLADLAVLSQDAFRVPIDALPMTVSVLTIVGGRVAYDAGVLAARPSARAPATRRRER